MWKAIGISMCTALLLASCGRPDASGIYLAASERRVTLIQIVETKDGGLTGRLEQVAVNADGTVKDETIPLDGAASGHELIFKPTSVWFGGLQASGTFSGDRLTLTGAGFTIEAGLSSLEDYQAAVAHLQSVAAGDRQRVGEAQVARARQATEVQVIADAANKTAIIEKGASQLRDDTAKMNAAIASCPDFHQRAAVNTARIAKMLEVAPTLSDVARNQLVVEENQVQVGTNQIEVARSQYAIALNQLVQDAGPIAEQLQRFCSSPEGVQFIQPCGPAKVAAADFTTSLARGRSAFLGYKQAVQDELDRQSALIRRMNG
jgi:hypothetical protein